MGDHQRMHGGASGGGIHSRMVGLKEKHYALLSYSIERLFIASSFYIVLYYMYLPGLQDIA